MLQGVPAHALAVGGVGQRDDQGRRQIGVSGAPQQVGSLMPDDIVRCRIEKERAHGIGLPPDGDRGEPLLKIVGQSLGEGQDGVKEVGEMPVEGRLGAELHGRNTKTGIVQYFAIECWLDRSPGETALMHRGRRKRV